MFFLLGRYESTPGRGRLRDHSPDDAGDSCRSEEVLALQQYPQCPEPGRLGVPHDRRPILRRHQHLVKSQGLPTLRLEWGDS